MIKHNNEDTLHLAISLKYFARDNICKAFDLSVCTPYSDLGAFNIRFQMRQREYLERWAVLTMKEHAKIPEEYLWMED